MAAIAGRTAAVASAPGGLQFSTDVGRQIFVYYKIDTNQTVYSLTRSLKNKEALKQLTFVGKKSVPPALRKDLWTPLCVISFPNALQGHSAYKKLLEFKHLHEMSYPLDVVQDPNRPAGHRLPKKEQTRQLQDQKANSIADMAYVLAMQGRPPSEAALKHARYMVHGEGVKRRPRGVPMNKHTPGKKHTAEVLEFQGKLKGVSIWWADPMDAEFAETWPADVIHGPLAVNRYTAIWPPPEEILLGKTNASGLPSDSGSITVTDASGEQGGRWSRWFGGRKASSEAQNEPAVA